MTVLSCLLGYKKQDHAHKLSADCGPPSVFLGNVSYLNTTEGSEAHYHCDDGFTLEGEMTAVCKADRRWSSPPVCRPSTGSTIKNMSRSLTR